MQPFICITTNQNSTVQKENSICSSNTPKCPPEQLVLDITHTTGFNEIYYDESRAKFSVKVDSRITVSKTGSHN